ncbi:MAG: hypothetical protein KBA75_03140 [Alphaproteobacteria bacterium]|nr:hypothetical protein [Alphaproteobacteria bacterium]
MAISKEILGVLVDLVENKLSCMQVSDRDDMREVMMLQRCLSELQTANGGERDMVGLLAQMPRRGRRRRVATEMAG